VAAAALERRLEGVPGEGSWCGLVYDLGFGLSCRRRLHSLTLGRCEAYSQGWWKSPLV